MIQALNRSRRAVPAALSLLVALLLFATPARGDTAGTLDAEILGLEPAVLVAGSQLTLRVGVTNRTDATVEEGTVRLLAQEWTPNTLQSLARWLEPGRYDATLLLASADLPALPPGAGHTATISVDAAAFGFDTWGPRGIEVLASAPPNADGDQSGSDRERAWVLWWNEPQVTPVGVGVLSPVVPTVAELGGPTVASSRIAALLRQAELPGVTAVLDPSLVPDAVPEVPAGAWTLPWGNADTAALVDARQPVAGLYDDGPAGTVDWLATPDLATLAGTAGDVVVVPGSLVTPQDLRAYTPHGVGELAGRTAVVVDPELTDALVGTPGAGGGDLVQRRQLLAATTAVLVRERPGTARTVFAALPLDDDASRADLIRGLAELPWVRPTPLDDALADDARTALRASLPEVADLPRSAVTAADLRLAASTAQELEAFREVLGSPVIDPFLRDLALVPALAWREAPTVRDGIVRDAADAAEQFATGLQIRGASNINLVSESANFPVTVVSALPVDATVQLVLVPSERGLEQAAPVEVTVPANGEVSTTVPVSGVGWGDITVTAHLSTPSGVQLGDAVEILYASGRTGRTSP